MTDSELEILSILQEFHSKLDDIGNEVLNESTNNRIKNKKSFILRKFFESHSESDHDSDYESEDESENELEKITYNIIHDIKTEVNEFCMLIPRVYIITKLRDFKNMQNGEQSHV